MKAFIVIIIVILGMYIAYTALTSLKEAYSSTSWSTAKGVVFEHSMNSSKISSAQSHKDISRRIPNQVNDYEVIYQYRVGELIYQGKRIRIGGFTNKKSIQSTFKIGQEVDVFYNPKNPKKSALIVGIQIADVILLIVGILLNILAYRLFRNV